MAKREKMLLTDGEIVALTKISNSRTEPAAKVQRAQILLLYSDGHRITDIAEKLQTNRPLIERIVDKALLLDPINALKDLPRRGRSRTMTDDAISWVLTIACQKSTDFGYAVETWCYNQLAKHIRKHCHEYGHGSLSMTRRNSSYYNMRLPAENLIGEEGGRTYLSDEAV